MTQMINFYSILGGLRAKIGLGARKLGVLPKSCFWLTNEVILAGFMDDTFTRLPKYFFKVFIWDKSAVSGCLEPFKSFWGKIHPPTLAVDGFSARLWVTRRSTSQRTSLQTWMALTFLSEIRLARRQFSRGFRSNPTSILPRTCPFWREQREKSL